MMAARLWLRVFLLLQSLASAFCINRQTRPLSLVRSSDGSEDQGISVGIDLGTTNSAIAYLNDATGLPEIIQVPQAGGRTIPSVVCFESENVVLVGKPACQREMECGGAYRNVKRVIGTGGRMVAADVTSVVPHVIVNPNGKTYKKDSLLNQLHDAENHPTLLRSTLARSDTATLRPEEISSYILQTLKQAAEEHTGRAVARAVIGVPSYFNDAQRQATERAAHLAGFTKVKLLREPEAAALAYGVGKEEQRVTNSGGKENVEDELVLVFDLGGGTFDVSILLVGGGLTEVLSTSGNVKLGGSDLDRRIAQHLMTVVNEHRKQTKLVKASWSQIAKNAAVRVAEQARIYLSNSRTVQLRLPNNPPAWEQIVDEKSLFSPPTTSAATGESDTSEHLDYTLTRRKMEELCNDEFLALLRPIREICIMAGALLPGDANPAAVEAALAMEEELSVSSSMEYENFYNDESQVDDDLETTASLNQAKRSQQKGRKKARDVSKGEKKYRAEKRRIETSTIVEEGVKIRNGISGRPISRVVLVGGVTRTPAIGRLIAALTGVVPQRTVNPDEAVALGCAIHAGILDGRENLGTVLNPMQAAILHAMMAKQKGIMEPIDDDFSDDAEFETIEYF